MGIESVEQKRKYVYKGKTKRNKKKLEGRIKPPMVFLWRSATLDTRRLESFSACHRLQDQRKTGADCFVFYSLMLTHLTSFDCVMKLLLFIPQNFFFHIFLLLNSRLSLSFYSIRFLFFFCFVIVLPHLLFIRNEIISQTNWNWNQINQKTSTRLIRTSQ